VKIAVAICRRVFFLLLYLKNKVVYENETFSSISSNDAEKLFRLLPGRFTHQQVNRKQNVVPPVMTAATVRARQKISTFYKKMKVK
jgi:hypothetical protein